MMTIDPAESSKILQSAVEALKRGDRVTAQRLAQQAASLSPDTEAPWLILAALASPAESLEYVRKALKINPDSQATRQAWDWALRRLPAQPAEEKVEPPPEPAQPVESEQPPEQVSPAEVKGTPKLVPQVEAIQLSEPVGPSDSAVLMAEAPPPPLRPVKQSKKRLSPGLIVLIVVLVVLVVAVLAAVIWLMPQLRNSLGTLSPGPQPTFQVLLPTRQTSCDPGLALGAHSFAVHTIKPASGANWDVPADDSMHAYWVEGTQTHAFFVLSPAPDNVSLANSVTAGEAATVTWADCNTTTFLLTPATPGSLDSAALLDQSSPQITIFIPPAAASDGLVIQGGKQGEEITNFATSTPSDVPAEISVQKITTSADRSTITVSISIYNIGQSDATLTTNDISLTPKNAWPQPPVKTAPALPFVIKAGAMKPIDLTFPRPVTTIATLKVFTAVYDLEGY